MELYKNGSDVESRNPVFIPFLENKFDVIFHLEQDESWITDKQMNSFLLFKNMEKEDVDLYKRKMRAFYDNRVDSGLIINNNTIDIYSFNLENSFINVPRQGRGVDNYIIFYPETRWKIKGSEFFFEMEVLFKNNKVFLIQEMSGLSYRGDEHLYH